MSAATGLDSTVLETDDLIAALVAAGVGCYVLDLSTMRVRLARGVADELGFLDKREMTLSEFTRWAGSRIPPDEFAVAQACWGRALQGEDCVRYQTAWLQESGATAWTNMTLLGRYDASGRRSHILIVGRDETERRREVLALQKAEAMARAASAAKSDFLARVSHELRTPLNAIIGYGEILEESATERADEQDSADVQRLLGASRHLLSLIDCLLDLAKIEAGKFELAIDEVDFERLAQAVSETMAPVAEKAGNRLHLTVSGALPRGRTDAFRLKQCLFNLIGNAIKFTTGGDIWLTVSSPDGAQVVLSVRDTGSGIAPDALETIFRPFTQGRADIAIAKGGTGLGLAITRELTRMMGGEIEVQSIVGQGSTFTITLPAQAGANAQLAA